MKDVRLILIWAAAWLGLFVVAPARDFERDLWLARYSGYAALWCLVATLAATPLGFTKQRRTLGLTTAGFALLHGAFVITTPLVPELRLLIYEPQLRSGATALAVLLVLAATSFPKLFSVGAWKTLHRALYPAAGLALLHLLQSPFAPRAAVLFAGTTIVMLLLLRLRPRPQ